MDPIEREEFMQSWNVTFALCSWHVDGDTVTVRRIDGPAVMEADAVSFVVPDGVDMGDGLVVGVFQDGDPWSWIEPEGEIEPGVIVTAVLADLERGDGGWNATFEVFLGV